MTCCICRLHIGSAHKMTVTELLMNCWCCTSNKNQAGGKELLPSIACRLYVTDLSPLMTYRALPCGRMDILVKEGFCFLGSCPTDDWWDNIQEAAGRVEEVQLHRIIETEAGISLHCRLSGTRTVIGTIVLCVSS